MDPVRAATLVEEYLSGLSMREVAARHAIHPRTVQAAMRQLGVPTRSQAERSGAPLIEELVRLHCDGAGTAQIAQQFGMTEQRVRDRLRRHGVDLPRPSRPQPHKRTPGEIDALIGRYVAGETLAEIGRGLGVTGARVQQLIRGAGLPMEALNRQHRAARSRLRERADRERLDQTLAANPTWTVTELAKVTGMSSGRVKRLLGQESPALRRPPHRKARRTRVEGDIGALQGYAKAVGLPTGARLSGPAYDEWAREHGGVPSRAALVRRFGTWADAVKAAGYLPMVTPRRAYRRLSHADAVAVVAAFIADEQAAGRPPSSRHYPAWAQAHGAPSLAGLGLYWQWAELVTEALASPAASWRRPSALPSAGPLEEPR